MRKEKLDTSRLRKFAQFARQALHAQVSTQLDSVLRPSSLERREFPEAVTKLEESLKPLKGVKANAQSCLLYTSPSPRDRTRSRMPSSA